MCRQGFTLLEVLTALAIVGTALFVLLNAHHSALKMHLLTYEEVDFRQLVETAAARAEVEVLAGNYGDSGDFGARFPGFAWSFDAQQTGDDELVLLYGVSVSITGPDEERSLSFYVYDTGLGAENKEGASKDSSGSSRSNSSSRSDGSRNSKRPSNRSRGSSMYEE